MLFDQLHIELEKDECIRTNLVQNGYFYILYYSAGTRSSQLHGYDQMPLIYCASPDEHNINNFWGINLHFFTLDIQEYILTQMQKNYNIFNEDVRVILDGKQLKLVYSNIDIGLRCYNRKNVLDCYRIKNRYVPKYLGLDDKFKIIDNNDVKSSFELAPGNKGF